MIQMSAIVTLTTDFGISDSYLAAMKGRLLSLVPDLRLVDVSHTIPLGNILRGALAVRDVVPYFPPGTVHLVVIDPGVGSSRRPLLVRTPSWQAVGPDNGVLSLLWEGGADVRFFELQRDAVARGPVSNTFHGRDLFAPAAALLAAGRPAEELGLPLADPVRLELPAPVVAELSVVGEVLYHDSFGNLVTNIREDQLPGEPAGLLVEVAGRVVRGLAQNYTQHQGGLLALIGSTGLLEIAQPGGSAHQALGGDFGTRVRVTAADCRSITWR